MLFAWPRSRDIVYRLIRLRRLIGVAAVLPVLVAGVSGLAGWALTGEAPGSLVPVAVLSVVTMTGHAVLFPQARAETMALSLTLCLLIVAAPLAGASVLGWAVLVLLGLVALMVLQSRLLLWEMATPLRPMKVRAQVRSTLDAEEARKRFPLRPGREDARLICGPADAEGIFPVRLPAVSTGMADALCAAYPLPEGLEAEILAELDALDGEGGEDGATGPEPDEVGADFWAKILTDTVAGTDVLILTENAEGRLAEASRTTYRVFAKRQGCVLEESEVNPGFPIGAALGMWLTDFAQDGLVMTRDGLEGRETLSLRDTHDASLLNLIGFWLLRRRLAGMDAT